VNRLLAGSADLARRYCVWLWADGVGAALLRVVGGVAAAAFVGGICLAAPIVLAPVAAGWVLGAWHASRPQEESEDGADDYDPAEFLEHLHELMAKQDRLHLAQIAADLYDDPDATGQVRDLCAAAGVVITRGVRVPGRGVSTGLYRRDLPPLPDPSPLTPVAVVVAGQDEQQQQQHAGGEGFVITPDPAGNPRRWRVQWPDTQAS
jgi:hypothetical protein